MENHKVQINCGYALDSESVDVYVVRLGVGHIKFDGTGHHALQFHQNTEENKDEGTASPTPSSIPWVLRNWGVSTPNVDISTGVDAGKPRTTPSKYMERFFPLEGKTAVPSDNNGSRSYPICYVKKSTPQIVVTTGSSGFSQIDDAEYSSMGYPIAEYPIKLIVKQGADVLAVIGDVSDISPGGEYKFNGSKPVQDHVGIETLDFSYERHYKEKEKDKDSKDIWTRIPGSFSSVHECFTILDTPKSPWGELNRPWVKALDFAINDCGAGEKADGASALASITSHLHSGHGLRYDTTRGAAQFGVHELGGTFELAKYMLPKSPPSNVVNCYDQSAAVVVFGRLLGIQAEYKYLMPFGYINRTTLVSNIDTNNPFFNSPWPNTCPDPIFVPGTSIGYRTGFGNHAFVEFGTKIYDACAVPQVGTHDTTGYLNAVIDGAPPTANVITGNVHTIR